MDDLSLEVLARLPLADAVMSLCAYAVDGDFLNQVFEAHRGRSYETAVTFPALVNLISDALLQFEGSGRQAMLQAEEQNTLQASPQAMYGKLRRIPISLSNAFLMQTTARLCEVFPVQAACQLPASLRRFDATAIDGKKIKGAAKRLKPARGYSGTPLGGKTLVALDLRRGLIVAMNAHLDGETNDAPLVADLLPQVREQLQRSRLWIADSQFCDLTQPHNFLAENDVFLVRYHPKTKFHRDPDVPLRTESDAQRHYADEWGWLGKPHGKKSLYVRRITLFRKDEEDVILVTSLQDANQYPATELLDAYLLRWGIERVFQQVTEVFHLQRLISSTPQGTIFQCAFCFFLYNLIQVTRGYLAEAQQRRPETISTEMVFNDAHRQLVALTELVEFHNIVTYFQPHATAEDLMEHMRTRLHNVWRKGWTKSPTKRKAKKRKPTTIVRGGHTSLYRIIQASDAKPES